MSDAKEAELSLKVFINKEKTKVLFAEASNDFTDVLLSFLMLPLGRIVKVLEKHFGEKAPTIGSLTTLYNGLKKPDILTDSGKEKLDNPRSTFDFSNLKVRVDDSHLNTNDFGKPYSGVFTRNSASFFISDDLRIVPNLTGSILYTLEKLGIDVGDMEGAEMMNVTFGFKEILDLLKASFASRTPLSDLILGKKQIVFKVEMPLKVEDGTSLNQFKDEAVCYHWKMILKVTFQTHLCMSSTLSLLNEMKISLSDVEEVEFLVGKKECLSILKASLTSTRALKDGLINPKLKEQPMPEI